MQAMRHLLLAALSAACLAAPAAADPLESKRASSERLDATTGQGAVTAPTDTRRIGNQAGTSAAQIPLAPATRANETSGNTTSMSSQVMNSNVRVNVGR